MWPVLLDMTKEESMQHLRCLEIEAYAALVSALRAQGSLDQEKLKVLKDASSLLHISQERHKAEIRRVVNDEKFNTIAYHVNGERHSSEEWAEEGQRLIPLMARVAPQTAYSAIADEVADTASKLNKQLPSPSSTERKRPPPISPTHTNNLQQPECSKNVQMRPAEPEIKKRKLSLSLDNNVLPPHLMGPPKISKIQQIYRQKTKARQKEQLAKQVDKPEYVHVQQMTAAKPIAQIISQSPKVQPKVINQTLSNHPLHSSPKINILQNISIPAAHVASTSSDEQRPESSTTNIDLDQPCCSSDGQPPKMMNKVLNAMNKSNPLAIKTSTNEVQKTIKVCAPRKATPTKTVMTSTGQKLIVVSNPQSLTTSSILQRTLTTIPFKNISLKNLDKIKIVSSTGGVPSSIQLQNSKQKVVTVRANPKKLVPFSQVQVLSTKTGIKFPLTGKLIPKNNSNSIYAINSASGECTKSISSTPVMVSSKEVQENVQSEEMQQEESTNVPLVDVFSSEVQSEALADVNIEMDSPEAAVVCEHQTSNDVIPIAAEEDVLCDLKDAVTDSMDNNVTIQENIEEEEEIELKADSEDGVNSYYIFDGETATQDIVIDNLQQPLEVLNIMDNLDPMSGQYSMGDGEQPVISLVESDRLEPETPEVELNVTN